MESRFRDLVDALHPKYEALLTMAPVSPCDLPKPLPSRVVYLFSSGATHLYVGRTNNLRRRVRNHCGASSDHRQAVLAFRMARLGTGNVKATYTVAGSRNALATDPDFHEAFVASKKRVSALDLRYVEEIDPVRQALLEIYVATALRTPFNDFENH